MSDPNNIDMQFFLSLMDSIHDFGNTGRISGVVSKKIKNKSNDEDDPESISSDFNPAFLLDFLMLSIIHDKFKDLIGLSEKQNYLTSRVDCDFEKNFIKKNILSRDICLKFYYPTYSNKIIFRSPEPESITNEILLKFLRVSSPNDIINYDNKYKFTLQFAEHINLGKKKEPTSGFYSLCDNEKSKYFSLMIKNFLQLDENTNILYVLDANQLDNKLFKIPDKTSIYVGIFTKYDSYNQKQIGGSGDDEDDEPKPIQKKKLVLPPKKNKQEDVKISSVPISTYQKEFQKYELTSKNKELIFLDRLGVYNDNDSYGISYDKGNKKNIQVRIYSERGTGGLALFVKILNEINKKTMGPLVLRPNIKRKLKTKLEEAGIEGLIDRYQISVHEYDASIDQKIKDLIDLGKTKCDQDIIELVNKRKCELLLNQVDFILTLLDFKRAMDYLYVKAAYTANNNNNNPLNNSPSTSTNPSINHKYIFVSSDRSAISYSINLGVPCILTIPAKRDGTQEIVLYNPLYKEANSDRELDDINSIIEEAKNTDKKYELLDKLKVTKDKLLENDILLAKEELSLKSKKTNIDKRNIKVEIDKVKCKRNDISKNIDIISNLITIAEIQNKDIKDSLIIESKYVKENEEENEEDIINDDIDYLLEDKMTKKYCKLFMKEINELGEKGGTIKIPKGFSLGNRKRTLNTKNCDDKKLIDKIKQYCNNYFKQEGGFQFHKCIKGKDKSFCIYHDKVIDELPNYFNNSDKEHYSKLKDALNKEIPILDGLLSVNKYQTNMQLLLECYSELSPTITLFWYIVFKSICDLIGDEKAGFDEDEYIEYDI